MPRYCSLLALLQLAGWVALLKFSPSKSRLKPAAMPQFPEVVSRAPYLVGLAALVLLAAMSAATLDFLFKVQAVSRFGQGVGLTRFFALFYAISSVATFVVQAGVSRFWLDRFGLGLSVAVLPAAVTG